MSAPRQARGTLAAALLLAALALGLAAYWPGVMTWDSAREYATALRDPIDDWHPPVLIWAWRQLLRVAPGPGPMLALQMGLYVGGWGLLAWRGGRGRLRVALAACALFPIALVIEGAVLKDSLLAGALLAAAGLIAPDEPGRPARATALALLVLAATLRFNAFLACLPLAVAALPVAWRRTAPRLTGAVGGVIVILLAATPVANRLIGAKPSHVELSQILFDLGGITRFSGVDAFPPVPAVGDPVAANRRCYDPGLWDAYAWWTPSPCPIGWANAGGELTAPGVSAYRWWLAAIARRPAAYAWHRLAHFNLNTRFLVADAPPELIPEQPDPNPYGYDPPANQLRTWLEATAVAVARTPLGWPICWIALAAGVLVLRPARPAALPAGSALLYGSGYLALSVASDPRYHLWTMLAALAGAVLASPRAATCWREDRWRALLAMAPLLTVIAAGGTARMILA